jgi:2-dehydropantoate 2-reductase
MKVAVIGCGALGSYYGAMLARAGHDTHFLLRSDYDFVRCHGVRILSPNGDFQARPHCARTPEEIGPADLVVIGLKTAANDEFPKLLPPVVGLHTVVLTLQNGLGNEEALARLFPAEQILGGLCYVCLNRIEPGVIWHSAHGEILIGGFRSRSGPRTHDIASALRHAGVKCEVTDNLERARWEKLVWNVPFNGLGVAAAAGIEAMLDPESPVTRVRPVMTTDQLLADPRWFALVREVMLEIITAANAKGLVIEPAYAQANIDRTLKLGAYRASTLVDFERGQPLELESLFLEPLRQTKAAGIAAPRLARLGEVLKALNPGHDDLTEKAGPHGLEP